MARQNTLRSHKARSQAANRIREGLPFPPSFFDKEAITEFLLLEDLVALYKRLMALEEGRDVKTRYGELGKERQIAAYASLIKVFTASQELCESAIYSGNYKAVWGAIPEGALMRAANKVKLLPQMRAMATKMLEGLSKDMLTATAEAMAMDDDADMIEINENNTRRIKGLPSEAEIQAIIHEAELLIPDVIEKKVARKNTLPTV